MLGGIMKKAPSLILALVVSNSTFATDLDTITQNVKSVCQSPSQAGNYWNVTATGKADAKGNIRLASVGVNGKATFTQGEWEGVQQVLKAQQSADNANYRDCAVKLTPLFIEKFAASAPAAESTNTNKAKSKPTQTIKYKDIKKDAKRVTKENEGALKYKNTKNIEQNNFVITGGTNDEIKAIKSALNSLNVVAATIDITRSAIDSSRNVNIRVTYQDNTVFSDSFNTPLDNASNTIISLIDNGGIKK